jgi:hypothetical protein
MKYLNFLPLFFLLACDNDRQSDNNKKKLTGEWENISLRVTLHTFQGTDSTRLVEVPEGKWEEIMGIRPIRTFYRENGTYNSRHYSLGDSLFYNPSGKWHFSGDSLVMTDTFPENGKTYRYLVRFEDDFAEFIGKEDVDGDGENDDDYHGLQRRVKDSSPGSE